MRNIALFAFLAVATLTSMKPRQHDGRSITIRLNSPTTFQEHITYVISNNGQEGQLIRHRNDKVEYKKVMKNKAYPKYLKKKQNILILSPEQQYHIWDSVDSLYDIYSHRQINKADINTRENAQYFRLLDSIYAAPEAVFTVKNPRRVLDGLYYQITVKNNGHEKRFYVNTPNNQLHPQLTRLLVQTKRLLNVDVVDKKKDE